MSQFLSSGSPGSLEWGVASDGFKSPDARDPVSRGMSHNLRRTGSAADWTAFSAISSMGSDTSEKEDSGGFWRACSVDRLESSLLDS
jgi:hypothetical protein